MAKIRNTLTNIIALILLCVAVVTTGSISYAKEDGFFFMERPKLGLNTSYELEEEKRDTSGLETKTTEHDIRESATIATNGWVYHPNLMEYHFSFKPEWRQDKFEQSQSATDFNQTDRLDTSSFDYDVGTTLLRKKPCSLDLFANHNTQQINLSYVPDYDLNSKTWGARFNFKNPTLPVSIGFVNRKTDQNGFYSSDEDRNEVQVDVKHNIKHSVTELSVLYDDADTTTRSASEATDTALKTTNTELTNTCFFTDDQRVRLDSLLYNTRANYNDVDHDTWVVSENLFWAHNKNLLTQYSCNYQRRKSDGFANDETDLSAGLTHRLRDRLTTNLGVDTTFNNFDGGSEDRYFSNLGFLFYQPIPWGNIKLGAGFNYGVTKRTGGQEIIPTEERHTLKTDEETFLYKENVIAESIVVTDIIGTTVYTENIDYRIQQVGPNVRISRTLLGAIADGQEVRVRYNYQIDSAYDDSRFGQDYSADLELWSLLYLTYTYGRLNQNVISGEAPDDLINNTYNSVRVRLETRWSETQFLYERQNRSNSNSSITQSVRQLLHFRPLRKLSFNFSGDYGHRDYPDINQTEKFYTIGTTIGWMLKWWCNFNLVGQINTISGDHQDMRYKEIGPTVILTYGVWTGTINYRLTDQNDRENEDRLWRQRIYFAVNRALW